MVRVEKVTKVFRQGRQEVRALNGVDLELPPGQFCVITGASGSGKSTLLHLIGGLDGVTSGEIFINGAGISILTDDEITLFRRRKLGFIFHSLSVEENVALPLLLDGARLRQVRDKVDGLIERVGLAHRRGHRPDELSGGEMQRVAIARALVIDPILLLADEPTGNLDSRTGEDILELVIALVKDRGHTMIMVTHDPRAAEHGDRIVTLQDGCVVHDTAATKRVTSVPV